MHELGITKSMAAAIKEECSERNIQEPVSVVLQVGELTTYSKDAIKFYFALIRKQDEFFKNTDLHVEIVKGEVFCNSCKKTHIVKDWFACPACESMDVELQKGKEVLIKSIEGKE